MRHIIKNLALWVLLYFLTACAKPADDIIRFGLSRLPVTLDPRFSTDAASSRVNRLLYQRLVDFDASAKPVAALAQWTLISPTIYRFKLMAEGRVFSNGQRLTTVDVKATYEYILEKDNASPHRMSLMNVKSINIINEDILDFVLIKPDVLFAGRLLIGILPASLIAESHAFNRNPVGSGDFDIVSWQGDSQLLIQRRVDNQQFEFVAVQDPTVRVLKLLRGEIQMLQNDLPPEMIRYLEQDDRVIVSKRAGSNFAYLGFNLEDEIAGNLLIRTAIAHALDRQAIITHVLGNAARPANALLPPKHWAGNNALIAYDYNPEKSRSLIKQAGYGQNKPLQITYKTSSDPFRLRLATIIQQQLGAVGIDVDLRSYDWGTFYGDIKAGHFQMYSLMWVGIKLPDIFRYVFHSSAIPPNGANRGRYVDAKVDRMIEAAEERATIADQAQDYYQLQKYLLQQLPYVPLWYEDHVFAARTTISGFELSADGNYDGLKNVNFQR